MHLPQVVSFVVCRSRWHGFVVLALCVVGGLVCVGLIASSPRDGYLACVVTALVALLAVNGWRKAPTGTLLWSDPHWRWIRGNNSVVVQRPVVILDLQRWMFVCFRRETLRVFEGGHLCLWLEPSSAADAGWIQLRRALVLSQKLDEKGPKTLNSDAEASPRYSKDL